METLFNMTFTFDQLIIAIGLTGVAVSIFHWAGFTLMPDTIMKFLLAQRNTKWYAALSTVVLALIFIGLVVILALGAAWIVLMYAPTWFAYTFIAALAIGALLVIGAICTWVAFKIFK